MSEAPVSAIKSPCTDVCKIHQPTGWCEGCARTIPEITLWSKADDEMRMAILKRLPNRRAELIELGIFTAADPALQP
jgi:predicted Fe-S protein YdhL (DUF1289 family)